MSTSLSQRSSGTATNPTRQQLDELDALLQRMMDLPVNKLENVEAARAGANQTPPVSYTTPDEAEEPPAVAQPKIDFQALKQRLEAMPQLMQELSARAASTPLAAPPETDNDGNWVPLSSTWQPSSLTWKPLAQSWQAPPEPHAAAPPPAAAEPAPVTDPAPPPFPSHHFRSAPPQPAPAPAQLELPLEPPIARWAMPLVWLNHGFDLCLTLLGPVGWFLRTRIGRLGLAIVGLGCAIAAGVVLVLDWIGWTS